MARMVLEAHYQIYYKIRVLKLKNPHFNMKIEAWIAHLFTND